MFFFEKFALFCREIVQLTTETRTSIEINLT